MPTIDEVRKNIILKDGIYYFDYTASGLAYAPIEDEISNFLKTYANTHSDSSSSAVLTQKRYENARAELKELLGLDDSFYLIATGQGATAAIKKFQEIMGIYLPPATRALIGEANLRSVNLPLVLVGPYEHHSNEISFREGLCDCERTLLDENGEIDYVMLERTLKLNAKRKIIACFSAASNVTGVISDYKQIYTLVKKFGGIVAFDVASLSAYANLDCDYFDALFISPHKLLGGVGSCGLLAIKKVLANDDVPSFAGGGTVSYVSKNYHIFLKDQEALEEAGTPPILGLIRANLAYKLREEIGLATIYENESELSEYFCQRLREIPELVSYCPVNLKRLAIFSFNVKNVAPYELSKILSKEYGIQTRAGCSCAGSYGHDLLGLKEDPNFTHKPGWVRVSLHYTHTFEDIDYLVSAIKKSIEKYALSWQVKDPFDVKEISGCVGE
ncbi:MAG: aminotransferase class V-fold PLP-dependent enzyme [Campylobacter concisus]|nr:aminotransferase class V-fold PLP-dependent enzyme [Campylobacter concisus]